MSRERQTPAWLSYERIAAAFASEHYGGIATAVHPNVRLIGQLSGKSRQIDVLVEHRLERGSDSRIIVDAKNRSRRVDIKEVESFEGMMRDCSANRGVLICASGYTDGAFRRAQDAITLTVLAIEQVEEFGWVYEPCLGNCSGLKSGKRRGMVLWGEFLPIGRGLGWLVVQTGKCDGCHAFHVWCWDCGTKFSVPDGQVHTCGCELDWASVPESPESGHTGKPESIWLMVRQSGSSGLPVPIDRRPIR